MLAFRMWKCFLLSCKYGFQWQEHPRKLVWSLTPPTDQRTSIWKFYNISTKRLQTTPICNQNPPCYYAIHKKKTNPWCIGRNANNNTRVGCSILKQNLTRKSLTKPTQTKVGKTYDSALYFTQTHPHVAYMQFGKPPGTSSVELLTPLNHAYQCFKVHAITKLHADWHLNWFKLNPAQHNKFGRV